MISILSFESFELVLCSWSGAFGPTVFSIEDSSFTRFRGFDSVLAGSRDRASTDKDIYSLFGPLEGVAPVFAFWIPLFNPSA